MRSHRRCRWWVGAVSWGSNYLCRLGNGARKTLVHLKIGEGCYGFRVS